MKKCLFLLLLPLSFLSFSQDLPKADGYFGFHTGINISKTDVDSFDAKAGYLPFLGVSYNKEYYPKLNLKIAGYYTLKGVNVSSPYYKYRYHYLETNLGGQYSATNNLKLDFGLQPSVLLSSKLITGTEASDIINLNDDRFKYQLDGYAGFELRLQNNTYLGARYFYPIRKIGFSGLQFSINYYFTQDGLKNSFIKDKNSAYQEIIKMYDGVLLVRLHTNEGKINALEEQGNYKLADATRKLQEIENQEIIDSFRKYFEFCSVYFFYSNYSNEIIDRNYIHVFDFDKNPIDQIKLLEDKNIYIAEFGIFEQNRFDEDEEIASTISDLQKYGLVIKDNNFNVIPDPFPNFVEIKGVIGNITKTQAIWYMNKKLLSFYNKAKTEIK